MPPAQAPFQGLPDRAGVRWADARDAGLVLYLPAMALASWLLPERSWDRHCIQAARLRAGVSTSWFAARTALVAELLGRDIPRDQARAIVLELSANTHRARLQILRCHRQPAWQPRLELVGIQRVEDGLRAGHGVIMWLAPFVFDSLLTKMAFHRAGLALSHLSRSGHGVSVTRAGSRFLNPVWTTIEDRYLAERLTMTHDGSAGALRALVERVRRNVIVSVTVGSQGQKTSVTPFLTGTIRLAEAVPRLASRTGATVLPVFTVREPDGRFVTTVETPLEPSEGHGPPLIGQMAARLESWVRRYPGQFMVWEDVTAGGVS